MTKVKICCIRSINEADMAIENGATFIGLVGPMPSGPGVISNEEIAKIVKYINGSSETVLLTSETSAKGIIEHHSQVKTSCIQIVDSLLKGSYNDIRRAIPHVKLIQVIHVVDNSVILQAKELDGKVDYILLDSGDPKRDVKILGGTGKTHNWKISAEIIRSVQTPIFLAGGLHKDNVSEAISYVKPYGVDLCSGVRTDGNLNYNMLQEFATVVKSAEE